MNFTLQIKLSGHKGSIYTILYDSVSKQVFTGGGDGWLVQWTKGEKDGKLIADVGDQIFSMANVRRDFLALGAMNGELYFIDRSNRLPPRKKIFHRKGIYDLHPFDQYLISAGGDGKLGFWNTETTEIEESVSLSHQRLRCLALNRDKTQLAVGASDGIITVLSTHDWSIITRIERAHTPSVFTLSWWGDDYLISGGRDAHLKVWNTKDPLRPEQDLAAHWFTINHLKVHPYLNLVATASRDKTIRLWSLDDFRLVQSLDATKSGGHINSVNRVSWTNDGKQLYSVSDDATIGVWDFNF